ncbi:MULTISPECIES: diguanylate cyclase [Pseudomonas]|uniref:GGDEF domain-containing protein n=1 Tax=Pseudomonas TaxID=286 RepID=UPI000C87E736|nr:hypothetical protein C1X28_10140 [Pseudomonas sp. FW305-BF15]PNB50089.1 hypothetical protein C1X29_10245 [Pseudomonas sp. GW456-12-10-14-LB2]PNB80078.1 hypothetical protein C1X30_13915 [Pseudomonas sp. FW305-BF6]
MAGSSVCREYAGDSQGFENRLVETRDGAAVVAQIILKRLAQEPIAHRTSPFGRVSVSIGIAAATGSQLDTVQGLIAAADQALYQAKGAGRNQLAKSVASESYSPYTG